MLALATATGVIPSWVSATVASIVTATILALANFRRTKVEGANEALQQANAEISIYRSTVDRLTTQVEELQARQGRQEEEIHTLRTANSKLQEIVTGKVLPEHFNRLEKLLETRTARFDQMDKDHRDILALLGDRRG